MTAEEILTAHGLDRSKTPHLFEEVIAAMGEYAELEVKAALNKIIADQESVLLINEVK